MDVLGDIVDLNGDGIMNGYETVISAIIILSVFIGAIIVIFKSLRSVSSTKRKIDSFLDDWYGEDPRVGVDTRPGVLARLRNLESTRESDTVTLDDIQATVNQIQEQVNHELKRNGGSSTKDAAHQALEVANEIKAAQERDAQEQARFRAQYLQDQKVTRQEWEAVFSNVKDMIGKTPEEQMELWSHTAQAYTEKTLSEDDGE